MAPQPTCLYGMASLFPESLRTEPESSFVPDVELCLHAGPGKSPILTGEPTEVWRFTGEVLRGPPEALQAMPDSYLGPVLRLRKGSEGTSPILQRTNGPESQPPAQRRDSSHSQRFCCTEAKITCASTCSSKKRSEGLQSRCLPAELWLSNRESAKSTQVGLLLLGRTVRSTCGKADFHDRSLSRGQNFF